MTDQNDHPFQDLPAALVEDVVNNSRLVSDELLQTFNEIRENRTNYRQALEDTGLLAREGDLDHVDQPTCCGVDGSYAVERLLSVDLIAAAAVAVEGLTPPSETRFWPEPRHKVILRSEKHSSETVSPLRATMIGNELLLAATAPHEIVLLDGSMTTPFIYFNQALTSIADISGPSLGLHQEFLQQLPEFLAFYKTILRSERTDRAWVAIPKYSTRREIGQLLGWGAHHDDRALLTSLLSPGEYTVPQRLTNVDREGRPTRWHLSTDAIAPEQRSDLEALVSTIVESLSRIMVFYYKPYRNIPAFRVELTDSIVGSRGRFAQVIQGLRHQSGTGGIMEPYPLYMADKMVKALSRAIPSFRQIVSQSLSENYDGDIDDIFLNLHGYRTESGR